MTTPTYRIATRTLASGRKVEVRVSMQGGEQCVEIAEGVTWRRLTDGEAFLPAGGPKLVQVSTEWVR